jgi:hypothetical protein
MRTLLQSAAVLLLLSLSGGTAVLAWDVHQFLGEARASLSRIDGVVQGAQKEWGNEAPQIHGILSSAQVAAAQSAALVSEQRKQLDKSSKDADNQVRAIGLITRNAETFFYNLDRNVNSKILPDFDSELKATSSAAQFSLASLSKAGDALTSQVQNPEWPQTLHGLNLSAANLALASANGASILGHVDHVAAYYDKQLTTPIGFWKTMLRELVPVAGAAGSVAAGFAK